MPCGRDLPDTAGVTAHPVDERGSIFPNSNQRLPAGTGEDTSSTRAFTIAVRQRQLILQTVRMQRAPLRPEVAPSSRRHRLRKCVRSQSQSG